MKLFNKTIVYSFFALSLLSCNSESFDEINTNPNSTDKPLTYGLFNSANKELMSSTRDEWASGRMALPWVQYSAQRSYTEEDRYAYRLTNGTELWADLYSVAKDYKKIIDLNTDPATSALMANYGPAENQIASSRIMLSYVFSILADSYGDVPYYSYGNADADFQALKGETNVSPKFATQQKIYADILKELKESSEMISTGDVVFTSGDQLFGNGAKLKKFANSLRLRIATRVKGKVAGADTHITDAIASGVMTSNADNVGVAYEDNMVNPSPLYLNFTTRSDFAISKTFVDLLKGTTGTMGQVDPRLFKYASPVGTAKATILDGSAAESTDPTKFNGMPYGIPSSMTASQRGSANFFSKNVLKKNYNEIIMEYSEVAFLLSEANSWDATNYQNGVKASMEKWGVPTASITAYTTTLPAASKANVLTQKYISLFMQPYESWAEYRRTGYPNTLLLPGQTYNLNSPVSGVSTYTFTSLITGLTDLPSRLFYPTSVQTLNKANYDAASTSIGGDKMNTKLIWDN